jgi:maltokinase
VTVRPPTPDELVPLLAQWLPRQRWFGRREETVEISAVHVVGRLTSDPAVSELVLVETPTATYTVPLVYRFEWVDTLAHVHVGTVGRDDQSFEVYDALHDKTVTGAWLRKIDREEFDHDAGRGLRAVRGATAGDLPLDEPSLVVSAEQSNTSLVFGNEAILKVFRRIEPGRNPDIEVHAALATRGSRHVAELLGHVEVSWTDSSGRPVDGDAAMLQQFLRSATDGWQLAQISVRDLISEGDLHADEVGGDFASESFRLGVATAETHTDMAAVLPTGSFDADDLHDLAAAMNRRLESAVSENRKLADHVDGLRAVFERVSTLPGPVPIHRVHGDLHLGQVLRTTQRWVMLDFEGEPMKPITERTALDSPLRDVAGMLRSFDYVARHLSADHPHEPQAAYRATEWADRNRDAFLDGYAEGSGQDLRADPSQVALLAAYEADKAVYELVYETRFRPSWTAIPLAAIARLAAA